MKVFQISPLAFVSCLFAVAAASIAGFLVASHTNSPSQQAQLQNDLNTMILKADSAATGKGIAMATGSISEEVEGVFVLDRLTGRLQCWLLSPLTGKISAVFSADAAAALGTDKGEPDYVMVTGGFFIKQRNGASRPANSVVYVADGKTGKFVGLSLVYNRTQLNNGVAQNGEMKVVCSGSIRDAAIRE